MYDPVSLIPPEPDDAPQLTVTVPKKPAPTEAGVEFMGLQERSLLIPASYCMIVRSMKTGAPPELLTTCSPRNVEASFVGCPWVPLPVVFTVLDPVAFT